MLAREVSLQYKGQVEFVSEDWDQSELAKRFGTKAYPVIFVDDVLVAQPTDFSAAFGKPGKYVPWNQQANRDRFRQDLTLVVKLLLKGDKSGAKQLGETVQELQVAQKLPSFSFTDLAGNAVNSTALKGKAVVVEFWATWCPPCRENLKWLQKIQPKFGDKLDVLALAIESEKPEVEKFIGSLNLQAKVAQVDMKFASQFSAFTSVPQTYVYDAKGSLVDVILGAPEGAHSRIEAAIEKAVG